MTVDKDFDALHQEPLLMTRYEACELIGVRATLLSQGATPALTPDEIESSTDHVIIATRELQLGRIKARIIRKYPSGETLEYDADTMVVPTL